MHERKTRYAVYNINCHMVWIPECRKNVLTEDVKAEMRKLFTVTAARNDMEILAAEVMPDHVHVFASAHPKIAPSYMIKMLKAVSGRKLLLAFPALRKTMYRGHLWNPSTYVETIGRISEDTIRRYIEDQKKG